MRFAYADPPYLGCCQKYDHDHGDDGRCWNDPQTHEILVARLVDEYPDGWAVSLSSPSPRIYLDACPPDVRVMPWVKPFASFKPNVNPAFCWEPVIVRGGRARTREQVTIRDWVSVNITLQKGLTGAKPIAFIHWLMDVLNVQGDDELDDLYPGTNVVGRVGDQARMAL